MVKPELTTLKQDQSSRRNKARTVTIRPVIKIDRTSAADIKALLRLTRATEDDFVKSAVICYKNILQENPHLIKGFKGKG